MDGFITIDIIQQQLAGTLTRQMRLVHDGRQLRCHKFGMLLIRETDERHILRYTQRSTFDGFHHRKRDYVIESENGIGRFGQREQPESGLVRYIEIYLMTLHQSSVHWDTIVIKGFRVTVFE